MKTNSGEDSVDELCLKGTFLVRKRNARIQIGAVLATRDEGSDWDLMRLQANTFRTLRLATQQMMAATARAAIANGGVTVACLAPAADRQRSSNREYRPASTTPSITVRMCSRSALDG